MAPSAWKNAPPAVAWLPASPVKFTRQAPPCLVPLRSIHPSSAPETRSQSASWLHAVFQCGLKGLSPFRARLHSMNRRLVPVLIHPPQACASGPEHRELDACLLRRQEETMPVFLKALRGRICSPAGHSPAQWSSHMKPGDMRSGGRGGMLA